MSDRLFWECESCGKLNPYDVEICDCIDYDIEITFKMRTEYFEANGDYVDDDKILKWYNSRR
jgi:hypothetical protein